MPSKFNITAYPNDSDNATPEDIKNKIVEGLKKGKPVLTLAVCLEKLKNGNCKDNLGHSMVVSGSKKVRKGTSCKTLFKIHNSWGLEWQKKYNNGWVDADTYMDSFVEEPIGQISSESVIWIE